MLGAGDRRISKPQPLSPQGPGPEGASACEQTMQRQAQDGKETGEGGQGGFPEGTTSKLTCEEQRGARKVEMGQWGWGGGEWLLSGSQGKA